MRAQTENRRQAEKGTRAGENLDVRGSSKGWTTDPRRRSRRANLLELVEYRAIGDGSWGYGMALGGVMLMGRDCWDTILDSAVPVSTESAADSGEWWHSGKVWKRLRQWALYLTICVRLFEPYLYGGTFGSSPRGTWPSRHNPLSQRYLIDIWSAYSLSLPDPCTNLHT